MLFEDVSLQVRSLPAPGENPAERDGERSFASVIWFTANAFTIAIAELVYLP
jgi:hypothetical protein